MAKRLCPFYVFFPVVMRALLWLPIWIILNFFCKFKVHGLENLSDICGINGILFVGNHASQVDPIAVNVALPFVSAYTPLFPATDAPKVLKENKKSFGLLYYAYSLPFFFRIFGGYPLFAKKGDFTEALPYQIELLQKGRSVLIFPEGKRTQDGKLGIVRPGVAFLLHHTNTTVVPVSISGTHNVSSLTFLRRKHTIIIRFGKPISRKDIFANNKNPDEQDLRRGAAEIMSEVEELLHR